MIFLTLYRATICSAEKLLQLLCDVLTHYVELVISFFYFMRNIANKNSSANHSRVSSNKCERKAPNVWSNQTSEKKQCWPRYWQPVSLYKWIYMSSRPAQLSKSYATYFFTQLQRVELSGYCKSFKPYQTLQTWKIIQLYPFNYP